MYVVSYFHQLGGHDWLTTADALRIIPIGMVTQSLTGPFGAALQKRYNPKLIMAVGSLIQISAMQIAARQTQWYYFFFFYGIMFPFGVGIVYYTPMICAWEWFPKNRGLAGGIIIAGYGLGASITGPLTTYVANPHNLFQVPNPVESSALKTIYPTEVTDKVPEMIKTVSYFFMLMGTVGTLCISRKPQ